MVESTYRIAACPDATAAARPFVLTGVVPEGWSRYSRSMTMTGASRQRAAHPEGHSLSTNSTEYPRADGRLLTHAKATRTLNFTICEI